MSAPIEVEQVSAGSHVCLTFTDPDERLDLLAVFVADGLGQRQRVLCYTDAIAPAVLLDELAQRGVGAAEAVARDQLRVTAWTACRPGAGGAGWMRAELSAQLQNAASDGFPALRVSADMAWATRPHAAAHELLRIEQDLGDALRREFDGGRLTTICQYDRGSFDPVSLAFAADIHNEAVAAQVYHEDPLLRICRQHRPPGVRIVGELDYRHLDVLRQALAETLRLDEHPQVNLRRLFYLDAAVAAAILQAAEQLPHGRMMSVPCGALAAKLLRLCGAESVPQLRIKETA